MARRHYSDADRAAALAAYTANGENLTRTAREVGVPVNTLKGWVMGRTAPPPAELCTQKVDDLADMFEAEVRAAYECLDAKRGEAGYRELATVIGIMTEKMLLLRGKNTARAEVVVRYVDDWRDADTQGE